MAVGADGLITCHISWERTPHLDPDCRVFSSASPQNTQSVNLRAVMEGVAYSLKNCLDIIKGNGIGIQRGQGIGRRRKGAVEADPGRPLRTPLHRELQRGSGPRVALLAGVSAGIQECSRGLRPNHQGGYTRILKDNHVTTEILQPLTTSAVTEE